MLDLTRTDEFLALRSAVRAVAADHIASLRPTPDLSATVPTPALDALHRMGLLTPRAVDDGGEGVPSHLEWAVIAEELGKADAGTALDVVSSAYAAIVVGRCGDGEQRRSLDTADARRRGTVLYFEGFGRSPLELATTATRRGESLALSGRKIAVVRARDSCYAVVFALTDGELRAVHLPAAALGSLSIVRDDAGAKIGTRAAATSVVDLAGVCGGRFLDAAPEIELHRAVAGLRLATCSILLGTGDAAVRYAAGYAAVREAFGQPISRFQGVAFPLVDAEIGLEAARLAVHDLAADIDGIGDGQQLADRTAAAVAAVAQAGTVATATAVNTLGGHGYLTDHPVERWYRDAAVLATIDFDPLLTDWSPTL